MSSPPSLSHDTQYSNLLAQLSSQSPIPSYSLLESYFNFLHQHHIRDPQRVVEYGLLLTTHYSSKLGLNIWDLYEKIFISCCDCGDHENSSRILEILMNKFGTESSRIKRLKAMKLESLYKYDSALELYNEILQQDPTNIHSLKREICIAKARNQVETAVKLLNKYLKTFNSDESAWIELSELYQQQSAAELAAFCYEELILLVPENYLYHLQLAELYYIIPNKQELARQYYAQSLELKPLNNLRALYGLINCLRIPKGNAGGSKELYSWALEKLFKHYEAFNPDYLPIVKQSLMESNNNNSTTTEQKDTFSTSLAASQ